eukprot:3638701-Amphidinium_carterae.1
MQPSALQGGHGALPALGDPQGAAQWLAQSSLYDQQRGEPPETGLNGNVAHCLVLEVTAVSSLNKEGRFCQRSWRSSMAPSWRRFWTLTCVELRAPGSVLSSAVEDADNPMLLSNWGTQHATRAGSMMRCSPEAEMPVQTGVPPPGLPHHDHEDLANGRRFKSLPNLLESTESSHMRTLFAE